MTGPRGEFPENAAPRSLHQTPPQSSNPGQTKKEWAHNTPPLREREPLRATPSSRVAVLPQWKRADDATAHISNEQPTRTANALRDSFARVRSDT